MKWHPFDREKGYRQKRPPLYRHVLVQIAADDKTGNPPAVAVGYRKNAAGDKSCPYFVIPGVGGNVIAWCDCLGDDFNAPLWPRTHKKVIRHD